MVVTINEELLNDIIHVVKLSDRRINTVVGEGNDNHHEEFTILNDTGCNDDFDHSDSLATSTKSFSSLDISRKEDASGSKQRRETRRGRGRRRSIKESIFSFSTSSSSSSQRRSSTKMRSSSPRSPRRFSLMSLVSRQQRLPTIKRKNRNKKRFSAAHISMEASTAFRQSTSTACTSVALAVSKSFHLPGEDDDDCVDSPFHQSLLAHAIH
jgi:hypothetical protein